MRALTIFELPLCITCCHARDLTARGEHVLTECILCRTPTPLRVPREVVRAVVEPIARAVGLIPDVEEQRLLDAVVAWREYDETHDPHEPGFSTAPFCRFDMALRDYRKALAAKLGKVEP